MKGGKRLAVRASVKQPRPGTFIGVHPDGWPSNMSNSTDVQFPFADTPQTENDKNKQTGIGALVLSLGVVLLCFAVVYWWQSKIPAEVLALVAAVTLGMFAFGVRAIWVNVVPEFTAWRNALEYKRAIAEVEELRQHLKDAYEIAKVLQAQRDDLQRELRAVMSRSADTVVVASRDKMYTASDIDDTWRAIHEWLADVMFDDAGQLQNVYQKNGQIAVSVPFKDGTEEYRRLNKVSHPWLIKKYQGGYLWNMSVRTRATAMRSLGFDL